MTAQVRTEQAGRRRRPALDTTATPADEHAATAERGGLRLAPQPTAPTEPEHAHGPIGDVVSAIAEQVTKRDMFAASPEHNMLAALLNSPTDEAAAVLDAVHDSDIQSHMVRVVLELIRELVALGQEPTPQAVMARARGPIETSPRPSFQQLTLFVIETYTMSMPLRLWADAAQVVEDAYRRSFYDHGTRIAQIADEHTVADIEDVEGYAMAAVNHWREMWRRVHAMRRRAAETTTVHTPPPPELSPEVPPPEDTAEP